MSASKYDLAGQRIERNQGKIISSTYDPRLATMLDRRVKQLKRVIHSAREWRKIADIRDEIIDILDAENLRMVRALEDMTPGGSEFYWDFDRCLEFVQQKMESLQEIAKRKSAIPPVPPEVK